MKKPPSTQTPGPVPEGTAAIGHNVHALFPLLTILNYLGIHTASPVLSRLMEEQLGPSPLVPTKDGTLKFDSVTEAGLAYLVRNAGTPACKRLQKWESLGLLPVVMALRSSTSPTEADRVAFDSFFRNVPKAFKAWLPRSFFQSIYQLLKHLASDREARRELRRLIDNMFCSEVATHLTPQQRERYLALKGSKARRYKFLAREAGAILLETARGVEALANVSQGSSELFRDHIAHVFLGREQLHFPFSYPNQPSFD